MYEYDGQFNSGRTFAKAHFDSYERTEKANARYRIFDKDRKENVTVIVIYKSSDSSFMNAHIRDSTFFSQITNCCK